MQAADQLGICEGAVRNRIKRGTLRGEREAGRVYVLLAGTTNRDEPADESQLVAVLREQLQAERQAHAEARRIIAGLVERIPAIEAPSEERESPQTVEEASDRAARAAEPQPATGGTHEGTERPQQRSGWLAPVNRLPWWHYVLGLIAVAVASGFVSHPWWGNFALGSDPASFILFVLPVWVVPGIFGFSVGLKRQHLSLWRHLVPVGSIVAAIMVLAAIVVTSLTYGGRLTTEVLLGIVVLGSIPTLISYVSGATIGRALQRRTASKYPWLASDTNAAPSAPRSTTPGDSWSPRKQAILGFSGTLIAAFLSLLGSVVTAILSGSG